MHLQIFVSEGTPGSNPPTDTERSLSLLTSFAFYGYHNKLPQIEWFKTTETSPLANEEAGNLKSGCWLDYILLEPLRECLSHAPS